MLIIIVVLLITTYFPNTGLSSLNGNDNKQPVLGVFYDMKKIIVNSKAYGRHEILLDDEDYEYFSKFSCGVKKSHNTYYANINLLINGKYKFITMHREILGVLESNLLIDHKDGNGLNNQKNNLRICTCAENNRNRKNQKNSTSIFKGVYPHNQVKGSFVATISVNGVRKYLGVYKKELDAALAYKLAALELHGEFAHIPHIDLINEYEITIPVGYNTRKQLSSIFRGVTRYFRSTETNTRWIAQINVGRKGINLGVFNTEEEAALAYDLAAKKYFENRAILNFPD